MYYSWQSFFFLSLFIQYYMHYHSRFHSDYSLCDCLSFLSKETSSISTKNKYEIIWIAWIAFGCFVVMVCKWNFFSSGLSPVSRYSSERISADDTSRTEHYPWQRHLRESPPVFEQPSPAYDTHSLPQTRRQSRIHLSPIQTIPIRINHHQGSSNPVSPSLHTMSPPSYTELFLTPRTLTNRSETSVAHSALS